MLDNHAPVKEKYVIIRPNTYGTNAELRHAKVLEGWDGGLRWPPVLGFIYMFKKANSCDLSSFLNSKVFFFTKKE